MDWTDTLLAFRDWLKRADAPFPYIDQLPNEAKKSIEQTGPTASEVEGETYSWAPSSGVVYGELINFRGLQHAPVNENGVVFLFGMVADELGFVIESVQAGFPDCEGKRRVAANRFQRVRIEFEYRSRSFRDHGHDPAGCDLVVCWEHNWPECPLELLELREAIKRLTAER